VIVFFCFFFYCDIYPSETDFSNKKKRDRLSLTPVSREEKRCRCKRREAKLFSLKIMKKNDVH